MCGIAGYIGRNVIPDLRIEKTLHSMKRRGPDSQNFEIVSEDYRPGNLNVAFLHSRLSIIDLTERSNQPLTIGSCTLIFNGEIYNYIEIRSELKKLGVNFYTNSDTEVLLQAYLNYGNNFLARLEGMWSFAIWNRETKTLLLSRDRFGEKPLYYFNDENGFYFASEIKMLRNLSGVKLDINEKQLLRYLTLGYKSLYKDKETFFVDVFEVSQSTILEIKQTDADSKKINMTSSRYWSPNTKIESMSLGQAIEGSKYHLSESVRIRLRSDVPLAFCLSGGVDSSALVSIAAKVHGCNVASFSIIETDERYNEYDNIMATVNDVACKHTLVTIPQAEGLERLKKLINYHDAPIATTTFYVHSLLSEKISNAGYRVAFSGTAADELYTGYYDHYLLHLNEMRHHANYAKYLNDWEEYVAKFIRNPILKNPNLYMEDPNFREHVYDNSAEFLTWLQPGVVDEIDTSFKEDLYCDSLLRNRMLNELFCEATPVILHEDDLNSMYYSVENRSPYLDSKLCDFMYSVPAEYLIQNGYAKFILRESLSGILNDKVRLDRQKKGFNASINSLVDLRNTAVQEELLNESNHIFKFIKREKVIELFEQENLQNHYSKFVFSFINAQLFLEDFLNWGE